MGEKPEKEQPKIPRKNNQGETRGNSGDKEIKTQMGITSRLYGLLQPLTGTESSDDCSDEGYTIGSINSRSSTVDLSTTIITCS